MNNVLITASINSMGASLNFKKTVIVNVAIEEYPHQHISGCVDDFICFILTSILVNINNYIGMSSNAIDEDSTLYLRANLSWEENDLDTIAKRGINLDGLNIQHAHYLIKLLETNPDISKEIVNILYEHRLLFNAVVNLLSILTTVKGRFSLAEEATVMSIQTELNTICNSLTNKLFNLITPRMTTEIRNSVSSEQFEETGLKDQLSNLFNNLSTKEN